MLDSKTRKALLASQRNEITEHIIYGRLAKRQKNPHNRKLLEGMSKDELSHYNFWKRHTGEDADPKRLKIFKYYWISVIFGLTFGLKLMENGEEMAQGVYEKISRYIPGVKKVIEDEGRHESELVGMINEEKLKYVGSIVLGLNDALVEFTGALAGEHLELEVPLVAVLLAGNVEFQVVGEGRAEHLLVRHGSLEAIAQLVAGLGQLEMVAIE